MGIDQLVKTGLLGLQATRDGAPVAAQVGSEHVGAALPQWHEHQDQLLAHFRCGELFESASQFLAPSYVGL